MQFTPVIKTILDAIEAIGQEFVQLNNAKMAVDELQRKLEVSTAFLTETHINGFIDHVDDRN